MQLVFWPVGGIVIDVIPNCRQGPFVSDDVFVIITLPQSFIERWPDIFVNTLNIFVGR